MLKSNAISQLSCHAAKSNKNFLVAGVVRDCAQKVMADVLRLQSAIGEVKQLSWLLIESDSSDSTLDELEKLAKQIENFRYISMGVLSSSIHQRTARISHCRNLYVKEIRENPLYSNINYVFVSDFDGLNTHINQSAIESCWLNDIHWDACTANQQGPYYDIWALRHSEWSPNDCWVQFNFLSKFNSSLKKNLYASVHARMITIPTNSEWIEVDSAFGGLAIYRKELFNIGEYVGVDDKGKEVCEHVTFHAALKEVGCRIFINPRFLNAKYTEHTEHFIFSKSIVKNLRLVAKNVLVFFIGKNRVKKLKTAVRKWRYR